LTEKCLLKLTFEGEISSQTKDEINDNMFFIIEKMGSSASMVETFKDKIFTCVKKPARGQERLVDWKDFIC
jgi:hypothetical protein